jgi:hypothetical protein
MKHIGFKHQRENKQNSDKIYYAKFNYNSLWSSRLEPPWITFGSSWLLKVKESAFFVHFKIFARSFENLHCCVFIGYL